MPHHRQRDVGIVLPDHLQQRVLNADHNGRREQQVELDQRPDARVVGLVGERHEVQLALKLVEGLRHDGDGLVAALARQRLRPVRVQEHRGVQREPSLSQVVLHGNDDLVEAVQHGVALRATVQEKAGAQPDGHVLLRQVRVGELCGGGVPLGVPAEAAVPVPQRRGPGAGLKGVLPPVVEYYRRHVARRAALRLWQLLPVLGLEPPVHLVGRQCLKGGRRLHAQQLRGLQLRAVRRPPLGPQPAAVVVVPVEHD
mmetsp:Transcript_51707/g.86180  ORF Transcript_51707/g.86180 Transcript_51707/m.86180 type:complete len:255 (+) Transcript_51707:896-1660(+)